MSDEKPKPFAFMAPDPSMTGNEWEALYVAGIRLASHRPAYGGALPEVCDDINAAVERREVKLRGRINALEKQLRRVHDQFRADDERGVIDECPHSRTDSLLRNIEATFDADEDVGDYVPAAEHAALRKHIEGTWGVLLEQLSETPDALPFALAMAAELGIMEAREKLLAQGAAEALEMEAQSCADRAAYTGGEFPRALRSLAGELQARARVYRVQAGLEVPPPTVNVDVRRGNDAADALTYALSNAPRSARNAMRGGSLGVATANLEAGQEVEVDITNGTVSPARQQPQGVHSGPGRCACGTRWRQMFTPADQLPPRCPMCRAQIPAPTPPAAV